MNTYRCRHTRSRVIGSGTRRTQSEGITRRRECKECGYRWSTIEVPIDMRTGRRAPELIAKIRAAVDDICEEHHNPSTSRWFDEDGVPVETTQK